jgi:hypothetical protein
MHGNYLDNVTFIKVSRIWGLEVAVPVHKYLYGVI